ncbi:fructose-specific PTS transporter subunit EIIC [Streptomyces sp. NPDC005423]|uniref:fructose-specific PTS transporter subunit EIIC n=1 Tax=Streptomyces sp. NPDC005423 TaxID=3155343 RepID=UPI0033A27995
MTEQAGRPPTGGGEGERRRLKLLAVTACPTGIAHTYMAAEKLAQAAARIGVDMKVETQGSIGAENLLDDNDVSHTDGVIVAADKDVDLSRFVGRRVLTVGVAEAIRHPERLIERVRTAPVHAPDAAAGPVLPAAPLHGKQRGVAYRALMNGVSYMIPFVVVGGLLIAVSLSLGGHADPSGGLVIPKDSFWMNVNTIGVIGFTLMVPVLSGYIAYAIGDRPALVPGMIGGWIANTGSLYGSKAGAGFLGAIVTGFLAGYLVSWIRKIRVPKFVRPVMPVIVIPVVATTALGLFFIYVVGKPISWAFEHLTSWLSGMTGTSAVLLGAILGLMIAFDMGGPVNKTAFLFGAGLIATGNQTVMGMCAAAIPVMPIGQGVATLLRRGFYTEQEREAGPASLFMGCFGISEGAIPFAAARPAQVIPANMAGGAVAGAVAGLAGVKDAVPHGGPIVAVLGAVGGVPMFFVAVAIGAAVTALTTVALIGLSVRRQHEEQDDGGRRTGGVDAGWGSAAGSGCDAESGFGAGPGSDTTSGFGAGSGSAVVVGAGGGADVGAVDEEAVVAGRVAGGGSAEAGATMTVAGAPPEVLSGYLTGRTVKCQLGSRDKESAIREMAELLAATGKVTDVDELVATALRREARGTTGLGAQIAIPHAKTDAVSAPVVGFARSADGVEWNAMDGTKARLVFMIAVPEAAAGDEHLRILALLSRKLMDTGFRQRLLAAGDEEAVLRVLGEVG